MVCVCVWLQTVYDPWLMMVFNIVYTSAPIISLALFDMDVPAEVAFHNEPDVYCRSRDAMDFSVLVRLCSVSVFMPPGAFSYACALCCRRL